MYSPVLNKQGSRVWNLLKNCLQKKKCSLSPAAASEPAVKALSAVDAYSEDNLREALTRSTDLSENIQNKHLL